MAKGLAITGLVLDMISAVLLSLGVLTPELVRNAGNRVASYIISRPKATFLAAAHFEVFEPELEPEDLWGHFDKCLIEFAAFVLTWTIASAITLVILLSFSLWALMGTVSQPTANPVRFGLSIAGLLLSARGAFQKFLGYN